MPCVFPVLFLKGLALVQSGNEERHKLRTHGFVYAAGILVSFWVLVALLLGLRSAGSTARLGIPVPVAHLSLADGRPAVLPRPLARRPIRNRTHADQRGRLACRKAGLYRQLLHRRPRGHRRHALHRAIHGRAIGYALAQTAVVTFAVFTALALGLAAPYVALTLQPAWTRMLPAPGAWMEVLKQAVSVPIFGTVIWLAWVLAQAYGRPCSPHCWLSFLLLAIAGWFLGRWPAKRWSTCHRRRDCRWW